MATYRSTADTHFARLAHTQARQAASMGLLNFVTRVQGSYGSTGAQGQYRAMVESEDADATVALAESFNVWSSARNTIVRGWRSCLTCLLRTSCVGKCSSSSSTVEKLGQAMGLCLSHTRQFVNVPAEFPTLSNAFVASSAFYCWPSSLSK